MRLKSNNFSMTIVNGIGDCISNRHRLPCDFRADPSRLIFAEQLGRSSTAGRGPPN
jgi:hypothetical protein